MFPDLEKIRQESINDESGDSIVIGKYLLGFAHLLRLIAVFYGEKDPEGFRLTDFSDANIDFLKSFVELDEDLRIETARSFLRLIMLFSIAGIEESSHIFKKDKSSPEKARESLLSWLRTIDPMVSSVSNNGMELADALSVYDIECAISALNAGETPDIFRPSQRRGKERNAHTLSSKKLYFVLLCEELKKFVSASKVNKIMILAVGSPPDTIRKWKGAASAILSHDDYNRVSRDIRHFMELEDKDIIKRLEDRIMLSGRNLKLEIGFRAE